MIFLNQKLSFDKHLI